MIKIIHLWQIFQNALIVGVQKRVQRYELAVIVKVTTVKNVISGQCLEERNVRNAVIPPLQQKVKLSKAKDLQIINE